MTGHHHHTDAEVLRTLLEAVTLIEAATARSRAQKLIDQGARRVRDASDKLQKSRFSPSARLTFRAKVSGMLRRSAAKIAALGWEAGGGEGKPPPELTREYMTNQQKHLSNWFRQIKQAKALPGGAHRAQMYADSLMGLYQKAWGKGQEKKTGMPELPAYPRDGTTLCLVYCRCRWRIKKISDTEYKAYWILGVAEHCPNCKCRARHWNPLTIVLLDGVWTYKESRPGRVCEIYRGGQA